MSHLPPTEPRPRPTSKRLALTPFHDPCRLPLLSPFQCLSASFQPFFGFYSSLPSLVTHSTTVRALMLSYLRIVSLLESVGYTRTPQRFCVRVLSVQLSGTLSHCYAW